MMYRISPSFLLFFNTLLRAIAMDTNTMEYLQETIMFEDCNTIVISTSESSGKHPNIDKTNDIPNNLSFLSRSWKWNTEFQ